MNLSYGVSDEQLEDRTSMFGGGVGIEQEAHFRMGMDPLAFSQSNLRGCATLCSAKGNNTESCPLLQQNNYAMFFSKGHCVRNKHTENDMTLNK